MSQQCPNCGALCDEDFCEECGEDLAYFCGRLSMVGSRPSKPVTGVQFSPAAGDPNELQVH